MRHLSFLLTMSTMSHHCMHKELGAAFMSQVAMPSLQLFSPAHSLLRCSSHARRTVYPSFVHGCLRETGLAHGSVAFVGPAVPALQASTSG